MSRLDTPIMADGLGARLPYTALSSGQKGVGEVAVSSGVGVLLGFVITTDGTNDVTIDLYDKLSVGNDSEKLIPTFTVIGGDRYGGAVLGPVRFETGLYLSVSGANAKVVVYYQE